MPLSFAQATQAIAACVKAQVTPIIVGPPGVGKCLGEGTLVLMADGRVVPVEQIAVGNRLVGPDGRARTVLSTTHGRGLLYRVDPVKGEPWVRNDVHVLTLVDTDSDEVIDISLDKWRAASKWFRERHKLFSVGVQQFENAPAKLPIDPHFLGAWFGDGKKYLKELTDSTLCLERVEISTIDPEIRTLCEETARVWELTVKVDAHGDRCPMYRLTTDEHGGWQRGSNRNRLLQTLRDLVGSEVKIPDAYLRADRRARLAFLAGYLDTDGELANNCYVITQKREDWARSVWWIARSLGFCATITTRRSRDQYGHEGVYHVVTISGETDAIPVRLPRKKAEPRQQRKVATRTGFAVTEIGEGTYYGFTLDGDGRFLLGDFTVTHNTALVRVVAKVVDKPCHELLASNCDAVDIAGLPHVVNGELRRALLPQIKACVDAPGILFLDELTSVPPSVQAPLMRLLLEHYAGGQRLHAGSSIVGAANRPEECPGGVELTAASVNRVIKFVDYQPTLGEIRAFFDALGEEGSRFRDEALDFSATLSVNADLLDMTPPRPSIDAGVPFGSPRAWERGLKAYSEYCAAAGVGFNVGKKEDDIGYTILAGAVGEAKAIAFLAIREMRKNLPNVDEILKDPTKARIPERKDQQLAAIGLIARVADRDLWCAWIYAERLLPEIGISCGRVLMTRPANTTSKWFNQGKRASTDLLAKVRRIMTQ